MFPRNALCDDQGHSRLVSRLLSPLLSIMSLLTLYCGTYNLLSKQFVVSAHRTGEPVLATGEQESLAIPIPVMNLFRVLIVFYAIKNVVILLLFFINYIGNKMRKGN